jgi:hypothetical protein
MTNTNVNNPNGKNPNPGVDQKYQGDSDNRKQHQDRQADERKQSLQSGSNAGRNNIGPRRGKDRDRNAG